MPISPLEEAAARLFCRAWARCATGLHWDSAELGRRVDLDWRLWLNPDPKLKPNPKTSTT